MLEYWRDGREMFILEDWTATWLQMACRCQKDGYCTKIDLWEQVQETIPNLK